MITWDENRNRISELWPSYEPTDAERALFAERMSRLNQQWLADAIKGHRFEDASGKYKPEPSDIMKRYRRIDEAGTATVTGPDRRALGYRVTWPKSIDPYNNGKTITVILASREMYHQRSAAETEAARLGGDVLDVIA